MGTKGLDFKHKEVINITDGRRLRICTRCNSRLGNRDNYIYNSCKKENSSIRFKFDRECIKNSYITKLNQKRTGYIVKEKYVYDVICKVEM